MRTVVGVDGIAVILDRSVKRATVNMPGTGGSLRRVRELMAVLGTSIEVARRVDAAWHARSGARDDALWWDDWAAVVSGAEPRP